ncbi:hypothetical protein GCM10023187_23360 [Nibrella viscosa]|uniref:histidine kinase n=1 Tax=Nibrella viscosa TaxID=1084524 RepID=A0ABP8KE96_9BACT
MPTSILVVDDETPLESLMRQRFRHKIEDGTYTFRFAFSGKEALAAIEADAAIDVVLLDINMPDMSGLTLLNHLAEQLPTSRAVMVSAYGDMNNIRTAMNRGAFDFVTKPINYKDLELTIEKTARHVAQLREAVRVKAVADLKARFFDNITHEFRTPLTLIIAPTESLLQKHRSDEHSRRSLTTIRRNAHNLLHLINQLLDLARLEADSLPVTESRVNVLTFVRHMVDSFQEVARQKTIQLDLDTDGTAPDMAFDVDKWQKILANLLSNALKFTPPGGRVTLSLQTTPATVRIAVSDTGIGIAAEHLPHIFDRFYQVDSSLIRTYEGSGIGLALTHELTQLLGGQLTVSSRPGMGTTFTIELPARPASAHEPAADLRLSALESVPVLSQPEALPPTGDSELPLLLLVEDNAELLAFLAESLAGSFRVLTAPNGEEGLALAQRELPDIVVSDVMMPLMTGYQLTKALKTNPVTNHIAVVLLTARTTPENRHEGLSQGADDYLSKPFDLDELRLRLRNIIAHQQALRDYYSQQLGNPTVVSPTAPADAFLQTLYSFMEQHLDNSDLRAELLADEVAMSPRSLARKLNTLLGVSPARLIRQYRLLRATEMLRAGRPITETAYLVGFEHPANFTTAFKEIYHLTPSEFVANGRPETLPKS